MEEVVPVAKGLQTGRRDTQSRTSTSDRSKCSLKIVILNLMPEKVVTERQLLRLLQQSSHPLEITFLHMASHQSKHTSFDHLKRFYKAFEDIKEEKFDGLIITGAPVETLDFEEIDYWKELLEVLDWSSEHVQSVLHICWGAQAGLYARYGIPKYPLSRKLSGVYQQRVLDRTHPLMKGFEQSFPSPHSRYTEVREEDIASLDTIDILSKGSDVGLSVLASKDLREVYSFGHLEYDPDTLKQEYVRDCLASKSPAIPENYFEQDHPKGTIKHSWELPAGQFFTNWIHYAVYQG